MAVFLIYFAVPFHVIYCDHFKVGLRPGPLRCFYFDKTCKRNIALKMRYLRACLFLRDFSLLILMGNALQYGFFVILFALLVYLIYNC
jgi:hypothetical protein